MNRKLLRLGLVLFLVTLTGLFFTSNALAAQKYRVGAQVFNLGELIAQPLIEVEEGKSMGGTYTTPHGREYKFVVLVRPAADNQVFISLQFTSGTLNIQPDLLVDLNTPTPTTVKKTRLVLLVQKVKQSREAEQVALLGQ